MQKVRGQENGGSRYNHDIISCDSMIDMNIINFHAPGLFHVMGCLVVQLLTTKFILMKSGKLFWRNCALIGIVDLKLHAFHIETHSFIDPAMPWLLPPWLRNGAFCGWSNPRSWTGRNGPGAAMGCFYWLTSVLSSLWVKNAIPLSDILMNFH